MGRDHCPRYAISGPISYLTGISFYPTNHEDDPGICLYTCPFNTLRVQAFCQHFQIFIPHTKVVPSLDFRWLRESAQAQVFICNMADPQQYFYTPTSSRDESYAYSRSYESTGSTGSYSSYSQSTDYYTQKSQNGTVLRHRFSVPSDYAQNIDQDADYKKSLTSRKVIQRIDFFPKVDR